MFRNLRLSTIGCAILAILVASVEAQQQPVAHHGRVRVHFIAAEEIDWDYAPLGRDASTRRCGLLGDIEQVSESLKRYPWTTLAALKGDPQVLRKLEETEKLLKDLKKALSR